MKFITVWKFLIAMWLIFLVIDIFMLIYVRFDFMIATDTLVAITMLWFSNFMKEWTNGKKI